MQLFENPFDVFAHGRGGDFEDHTDLVVGFAVANPMKHFDFSRSEGTRSPFHRVRQ